MKDLYLPLILLLQALCFGCALTQQAQTRVQRIPLERQRRDPRSPDNYEPRKSGYDPKTDKVSAYDHKPQVKTLNAESGRYTLRWIGFDGREKTVSIQIPDAVDIVVSASVLKTGSGEYLYNYEINNLPSSATNLKRFLVQNLASDVKPEKSGDLMPFTMSSNIKVFAVGNWVSFADVSDDVKVDPGISATARLNSSAPPGLVECSVNGETIMEATDEEVPADLEASVLGNVEFPRGYTIGPVERLRGLSSSERADYVLDNLPRLRKLGWLNDQTHHWYTQHLKTTPWESVLQQAREDLQSGTITSEVFALIESIHN